MVKSVERTQQGKCPNVPELLQARGEATMVEHRGRGWVKHSGVEQNEWRTVSVKELKGGPAGTCLSCRTAILEATDES